MTCGAKAEASVSQGDRWKKLISKYMKAMPPMGRMPGSAEHNMACMSFVETQAISAKVGEAARPSQLAAWRDRRVSGGLFLTNMDVVILEFPVELRHYSALLRRMYGRTAGERE